MFLVFCFLIIVFVVVVVVISLFLRERKKVHMGCVGGKMSGSENIGRGNRDQNI